MSSFALGLYHLFSRFGGGLARRTLDRRIAAGKEDVERVGERMGVPGLPRPEGPLIWFHAASVGESLSILDLVRRLRMQRPNIHILVTTGTITSARLMAARLPEGAMHQFYPLDVLVAVRRFLDHWQPDVALWTESELWPTMLSELRNRKIPTVLINARMSQKSFRGWKWAPIAAQRIIGGFDLILAQDKDTAERLKQLGAKPATLHLSGSLKDSAAPLPHDEAERKRIAARLAGTQVWCAASTHPGEEEIAVDAHARVRLTHPGLILILVPRHPDRGPEIAERLTAQGWRVGLRSQGEKIGQEQAIYVADTLGELGLWYRIAPVSFIGGSLVDAGGHNPYEPAALGSAILNGPYVSNFTDAYGRLSMTGGARRVSNAASLAASVTELLSPDAAAAMATAAWDVASAGADTLDRVADRLAPLLDRIDT
ncbi:3-deoxy-D-manno-octulosonic acid transferase [Pontivivens ytuae]|uniref:3-deoxy-D-manno-octulosonic acid transferase n=1 Tax=Pontivivens ytuae TaxID=2789856 RepID=A0A7S9QDN2_9RHOB|nr:3-deoxy-D-manno-octulosonic acid transferase [Pontivivens ytuae]QPH55458.1 3-deoxy-D-manno-octulosonic acid transferase [Pontivivens ytuae]